MVTAVNEARVAVECLQKGAYDYLTKPVSRDELVSTFNRALERRRLLEVLSVGKTGTLPQIKHKDAFAPIVTQSEKMLRLLKEAELHAASDVPVLITGESGTGKELLARAIHRSSPRASFPFTSINMASLTGSLFDAEFFGHTKGAFTGAEKDRAGYLEHSNRGTLFLDEIGDLPLDFQGKTAPGPSGRRNHQARDQPGAQGRCPVHRGDKRRPGQAPGQGTCSARISYYRFEGGLAADSAASGTQGGHPDSHQRLHPGIPRRGRRRRSRG